MPRTSLPREQSLEPALCPFCRSPIPRPQEVSPPERPSLMPVGQCSQCGAVYAYDATGRNLGAAFVDALVFACNLDWDLAWSLLPDEDYRQEIVEGYHLEGHFVVPGGIWQGKRIKGALFFVRLAEDLQEVAREGLKQRLKNARPVKAPGSEKETLPPPAPLSKQEVERLIAEYHLEPIIAAAQQDKKVTRYLQRLLCAGEELTRLRAAEALGRTLARLLESQPAAAVAVFQGFFNHFNDSSASPWGCIDAIGETTARAPDTFARYLPRLFPLLEDSSLQEAVLRALTRVAEAKPELLRKLAPRLPEFLQSPRPAVRGYAARLVGMLGVKEAVPYLQPLTQDQEEVFFYREGGFLRKKVGELAAEALTQLKSF